MSAPNHNRGGFTLLELMLAMTMLSIVIVGVLESLTRQHKTSITTENIVEVQQNVRAISTLLEREIRMAGFMVPNAVGVCGIDNLAGGDEIFLSEIEPIVPDDERAGDLGARFAAGVTWPTGTTPPSTPTTVVRALDPTTVDLDGDGSFFYDNDNNGTPEADFREGGGFIVGDLANPQRGAACGIVNSVSSTSINLSHTGGNLLALISTDAEEELVIVPAAHYYMNTGSTTGRLERNGDLLAQGVDDIQFSYFFDNDDDGVIDAGEEVGISTATVYNPAGLDNENLKEVRFSVVVRTRQTDRDFSAGTFVNNENRTAVAGTDGFRRRVIIGAVRPRNIGNAGSI